MNTLCWFPVEFLASGSTGGLGFVVVLIGIVVSLVPPGDASNKLAFELELVVGTIGVHPSGLDSLLAWRTLESGSSRCHQRVLGDYHRPAIVLAAQTYS